MTCGTSKEFPNIPWLVTGDLGFIGNELVRQLKRDYEVVVPGNGYRVVPLLGNLSERLA